MSAPWPRLFLFAPTLVLSFIVGTAAGPILQTLRPAVAQSQVAEPTARSFSDSADAQIARLQQRLVVLPQDAAAHAALGNAYLTKARQTADVSYYAKAEGVLQRALELQSDSFDALTGLGRLALTRHQFRDALEWGERAKAIGPNVSTVYGILGDANIELGRFEAAFGDFQRMVDLRPDLSSYARVAYARELTGDIPGAIEAMRAAAEAGGYAGEEPAWARVQLGNLLMDYTNNSDGAEQDYRFALQAYPDYPPALAALARVAAGRDDLPGALELARQAATLLPLPEHITLLADLLQAAGQPEEAARQRALVRAIDRIAREAGADSGLEMAEFEADLNEQPQATLAAAQAAYQQRPSAKGGEVLAWALYQAGHVAEAQGRMAETLRLGVSHPLTLYRAARIARAAGDDAAALGYLSRALTENPHFSLRYAADAKQLLAEIQNGDAR